MVAESLEREASWSDAVRAFAAAHNGRMAPMVLPGTQWVRVRPPGLDELEDLARDPRCVKFSRVGTLVTALEADCRHVDVSCAGDRILWSLEDFLGTFVRAVPQESWAATDRELTARGARRERAGLA